MKGLLKRLFGKNSAQLSKQLEASQTEEVFKKSILRLRVATAMILNDSQKGTTPNISQIKAHQSKTDSLMLVALRKTIHD